MIFSLKCPDMGDPNQSIAYIILKLEMYVMVIQRKKFNVSIFENRSLIYRFK